MVGKARVGQWILIAIIAITALGEVVVTVLNIQAGRYRGSQAIRVLLQGWLWLQVWNGVAWTRWLMVVLFLAAAALAIGFAVTSPVAEANPDFAALMVGMGAVSVAFGAGLASPWVGAYQASRRHRLEEELSLPSNKAEQ